MSLKSIAAIPAIKALLLQMLAAALTLLFAVAWAVAGRTLDLLPAALIQGVLAAVFSVYFHQARWWIAIQFCFPLALVAALGWQLPSSIFLIAFLFLLLLYWSTFRTQVPFYPSGSAVQLAVADLLPRDRSICLIDIGSGLGDLILNLADRFPAHRFVGIEIAPLPWLLSWLRARLTGSHARFLRANYAHLDFADYDMIFAYLSPAAMPALWQKTQAEMRKESILLSYEFAIPGMTPSFVIDCGSSATPLYGFRM
jgi:hypothetical protein